MKINIFLWICCVLIQTNGITQEINPDSELFTQEEIAWIKKHPVIEFGYDTESPPYEFFENGNYSGIAADYIRMIEIHTDIDMVPIPNITWQKTIKGLQSGEIKVAAIAGITEERKKYLDFSSPYISDPLIIVTRNNHKFISGIDDLGGEKIILPKGFSTTDLIRKDFPNYTINTTKTIKDCLYQVSTGQADVFVGSLAVVSYHVNAYGFSNLKIAAPTRYEYIDLGFAVTKDWTIFKDIAQKVLDHLSKEEHLEIRNKWVSIKVEQGVSHETIREYTLYALGVLVFIVSLFLLWNKTLRNEINTRKRIELDLKKENQEKELLLKEVHHRVKNNLQIVHSMLNMQARKVDNDLTQKVLSESKSRVMAMAIVHKILYESEDLSTINIEEYTNSLADNIKRIYTSIDKDVTVAIAVKEIYLDIEKAIPVGLILNELLSNSYKHAFKKSNKGKILIEINKKDSRYHFCYSDDGEGITNYDMKAYKTLGMNLIYRLSNQLQTAAKIHITNTGFKISFSFIK